jgi:hypothetical protein
MKKFITAITILAFLFVGCASNQIKYQIPAGQTKNDFRDADEACRTETGFGSGGMFLFGPIIILFPVFIVLAIIESNKKNNFNKCMEDKGFKCTENCP